MPDFILRKAKTDDLDIIDKILTQGREFLHSQGLPQWQNGYGPTRESAAGDIERGEGFVPVNANGIVCGYAALIKGADECYTAICGTWDETCPEYAAIHRVALAADTRGKGLAKALIAGLIAEAVRQGIRDIRIDTHERNVIMRKVIEGSGFTLCGKVEFPFPNGERLAYQRLV